MSGFWCEFAWLDGGPVASVRVEVSHGRIDAVHPGAAALPADTRLAGLVLPGLADCHSHAFHRALRGRTHAGGGFWDWREAMFAVAGRLDPDSYLALARATYAELALAGVSAVGEFHYLHHRPDGGRYDDANAMGLALVRAAAEAGVRLTLLDTCYLSGGLDADGYVPLAGAQVRFGDGDAAGWARRHADLVDALADVDRVRLGAAVHSVRAVPADQLTHVAEASAGRPLHVHLSEQPLENEACEAHHGISPTALLARHGVLGPLTTAVHATHLSDADVALLGDSGTTVCACPSTEADLADGIGRFGDLREAGCPVSLGSDQHVAADLLAEARLLEHGQRLSGGLRGRFTPGELVAALTHDGHASLGWRDAGRIAVGQRADLVAVGLDDPRTAGALPAQLPLVAGAADVHTVVVDGRTIVQDGQHVLGDVGRLLREAVETSWEDA